MAATTDEKFLNGSGLSQLVTWIKSIFRTKNMGTTSGFTSKAMVTDSNGDISVSTVTATELSQLSGIGSTTIASQLSQKQDVLQNGEHVTLANDVVDVFEATTTGTDSAPSTTLGVVGFALPDLTTDGTTTQDNNVDNYVSESVRGYNSVIHTRKANTDHYGVVKLGAGTVSTNVKLVGVNSSGQLAVSVADTDISGKQDKIKIGSATSGAVTTISAGTNIGIDISGTTATIKGTYSYTLPVMTNSVRGGAKVYNNTAVTGTVNTVTTTAGKYYGIQKNSSEQLVVNVPWSDTKMTNKSYTAGNDANVVVGTTITGNNTLADVTKTLTAGSNISITPTASAITIANTYSYTLPTMGSSVKGGAYLGDGLYIDEDHLNISQATSSQIGGIYLYTLSGTESEDNNKAYSVAWINEWVVTPLGQKAPIASPNFTGTPKINGVNIATTTDISSALTSVAQFKGVVNSYSAITDTAYKTGWYWIVGTAGTYAGQKCEVGDQVWCKSDKGSSAANTDFSIVQTNIDTDVYVRDTDYLTSTEIETIISQAS